jgi:predicted transcriptional regulator
MPQERRGVETSDPSKTYDVKTGEVQEGTLLWVPKKARSQFGQDWFQMAQDTLKLINKNRKTLGMEGMAVFNALLSRLDFENFIQVSQTDLAAELEMKPSNVSRAVKKLIDHGFLKTGPKVGKSYTFQLHPELAWKGKTQKHFGAREMARKANWRIIEGGGSRAAITEQDNKDEPELPFDI